MRTASRDGSRSSCSSTEPVLLTLLKELALVELDRLRNGSAVNVPGIHINVPDIHVNVPDIHVIEHSTQLQILVHIQYTNVLSITTCK